MGKARKLLSGLLKTRPESGVLSRSVVECFYTRRRSPASRDVQLRFARGASSLVYGFVSGALIGAAFCWLYNRFAGTSGEPKGKSA
jgi:hypothetical protein